MMAGEAKLDAKRYLARIGIRGAVAPTAANLARLQRAHVVNVPYESLDIYFGRAGSLAVDELFEKIVVRRRGGYCFELNGLYAQLLRALGYEVEEYFGRWLFGEPLAVPARRHRVIKATVGGKAFVTDVGVGMRAPLEPLEFEFGKVQPREGLDYRIVRDPALGCVVQVRMDGKWRNFFSFDEAPQLPIDFTYVHYFCVNSPESFFRSRILVHRATRLGRNSASLEQDPETGLLAWQFCESARGGSRRFFARSDAEKSAALKRLFGIDFEFPKGIQ